MNKLATGLILAALGFGIAFYVLRSAKPDSTSVAEAAVQPAATGQLKEMNEVLVRAAPSLALEKPADVAPVTPGNGVAPSALPPEFEPILSKDSSARAFHDQFDREPREEPWASLMEDKWNTAFAANSELLAYGTPTAICRSTRCEIRMVAATRSALDTRWAQLLTKGVGKRAEGDQSAPLVTGISTAYLSSARNNGATVVLYSYQYQRGAPAANRANAPQGDFR